METRGDKVSTSTSNSPFVLSVYGILGREDIVIISNLSQIMVEKLEEPISDVCGWVSGWIAISVARNY